MSEITAHYEQSPALAQIAPLKALIAPEASPQELQLFAAVCQRTGLDPFAREIYCIHRAPRKGEHPKMTIQVGIDGLRKLAAATGQYAGSSVQWCAADGQWRDVWLESGPPAAAKAAVWRRGCERPFEAVARWQSYAQMYQGQPSGLWAKMPDLMLGKCAEALALRKGFPDGNLAGLYTPEEMAQADAVEVVPMAAPAAIAPESEAKVLIRAHWQELAQSLKQDFGVDFPASDVAKIIQANFGEGAKAESLTVEQAHEVCAMLDLHCGELATRAAWKDDLGAEVGNGNQ